MDIHEMRVHENSDQLWGGYTYAQTGDDLLILNLFKNLGMNKFSYIDVGAHHPYNISNTALMYERGCRGVNVEANPNLIENFKTARPEDINLNFGVAAKEGEMPFYMIDDWSGRNTFDRRSAEDFVKNNPQFTIRKIMSIPVVRLEWIIQEYCKGIWPDFMSIDIESLDYEVLKSLDLKDNGPKIIDVEEKGEHVIKMMREQGYEFCLNTGNAIYIRKECKEKAMLGH